MLGASWDVVTQVQSQREPGTEKLFREGWAQRTSKWAAASQLCFLPTQEKCPSVVVFFFKWDKPTPEGREFSSKLL